MTNQYFEKNPSSEHNQQEITLSFQDQSMFFLTDSGTFSKNRVDYGSRVLLESFCKHISNEQSQNILDLGSGYGPIAITLGKIYTKSKVIGVEINERAYLLAQDNAKRNQTDNVKFILNDACNYVSSTRFDDVVTNPPIRAGKEIIQTFVEVAYQHLNSKGRLWVVIQKKQGAPSMQKHMQFIFGNVEKVQQDKGYWILLSYKK